MKMFSDLFEKSSCRLVELRDRSCVLLEGYSCIESYSDTCITLSSSFERVAVDGEGLTLVHLSEQHIAIEGRIDGVRFI